MTGRHRVQLRIGDRVVPRYGRYSITLDMLEPADAFELELGPVTPDLWRLCAPDAECEVWIDDTRVLVGYIDRRAAVGGGAVTVSGRDKGGRLVDESMDLFTFHGLDLEQLAKRIASPWFREVRFSNAANRDLLRGAGAGKARAAGEPIFDRPKLAPEQKVAPGDTRWAVLLPWLQKARLLMWSTADGEALVIGKPNYAQAPQYRFLASPRRGSNARLEWSEDVGDAFSAVTVVGAGQGNAASYGSRVTRYQATALDGPGPFGEGRMFRRRKQLIVEDGDLRDQADSDARAAHELALHAGGARRVKISTHGHDQPFAAGSRPALFAPDTMAHIECDYTGEAGDYLISAVTFTDSGEGGQRTELVGIPKGTELTL